MKNLVFPTLLALCFFVLSCGGSKNTMQSAGDKNIATLLKKLNKNPDDPQVLSDQALNRLTRPARDRLGRRQRAAAGEDAELIEYSLF